MCQLHSEMKTTKSNHFSHKVNKFTFQNEVSFLSVTVFSPEMKPLKLLDCKVFKD